MPAIFNEQQKEKLRQQLLDNGFGMIKKYGYKKTTIDELTSSCGIAKGTFYGFFKNKEEFAYQLMLYERALDRKALSERISDDGTLSKESFHDYVLYLISENNNIFSYMTPEEITLLTTAWPDEYMSNLNNDEATSTWILDMLPDKRPDCDWKIFANYMKSIAIIITYKKLLIQDRIEEIINRFIQDMINYIWE